MVQARQDQFPFIYRLTVHPADTKLQCWCAKATTVLAGFLAALLPIVESASTKLSIEIDSVWDIALDTNAEFYLAFPFAMPCYESTQSWFQ